MNSYDAHQYWEKRLDTISLASVGHRPLGEEYNLWLYRMKKRQLQRCVHKFHLDVRGKSILDIGSGSGFYIDFWNNLGASTLVGIDITEAAVAFLQQRYPRHLFFCSDISEPHVPQLLRERFDLVGAFDVLYHVVEEEKFEHALRNISRLCHEGGYFILSDTFIQHNDPVPNPDYIKSRSLKVYENALQKAGFAILGRIPVFHTMIHANDLHTFFETALCPIIRRGITGIHRIRPNIAGMLAYAIDLSLNTLLAEGPSLEIMICQKV